MLSANYEAGPSASPAASVSGPPAVPARGRRPPDFDTYTEVSAGIVAILESVTAEVESASIDEAYLDVTGSRRAFGSPREIGEYLRAPGREADRASPARSASGPPSSSPRSPPAEPSRTDWSVLPGDVTSFLHPLPVERLVGVGEATAGKLHRLGIATVAQLARTPASTLQRAFGPHQERAAGRVAWGRDDRRVVARPGGAGSAAGRPSRPHTGDPALIRAELLRVASTVAWRMRRAGVLDRVITLTRPVRRLPHRLEVADHDQPHRLHRRPARPGARAVRHAELAALQRPRVHRDVHFCFPFC
ncbi:MAG: hypothetical protein R2719_08905 [Micropruina sp.]